MKARRRRLREGAWRQMKEYYPPQPPRPIALGPMGSHAGAQPAAPQPRSRSRPRASPLHWQLFYNEKNVTKVRPWTSHSPAPPRPAPPRPAPPRS